MTGRGRHFVDVVKGPLSAENVVCLTTIAMALQKHIGVLTMNVRTAWVGSQYRINIGLLKIENCWKAMVEAHSIPVQQRNRSIIILRVRRLAVLGTCV